MCVHVCRMSCVVISCVNVCTVYYMCACMHVICACMCMCVSRDASASILGIPQQGWGKADD